MTSLLKHTSTNTKDTPPITSISSTSYSKIDPPQCIVAYTEPSSSDGEKKVGDKTKAENQEVGGKRNTTSGTLQKVNTSVCPSLSFPGPSNPSYRDYSSMTIDSVLDTSAKNLPFPVKLHQILGKKEFENIISWLPHGRSWWVIDTKAFEEKVIPQYFRHTRYSSFMRQVNGWGFHRVSQGSDLNSYYHELFVRGMPQLCPKMRRPGKRQGSSLSFCGVAPDFYRMNEASPLPELSNSDETEFSNESTGAGVTENANISNSRKPTSKPEHSFDPDEPYHRKGEILDDKDLDLPKKSFCASVLGRLPTYPSRISGQIREVNQTTGSTQISDQPKNMPIIHEPIYHDKIGFENSADISSHGMSDSEQRSAQLGYLGGTAQIQLHQSMYRRYPQHIFQRQLQLHQRPYVGNFPIVLGVSDAFNEVNRLRQALVASRHQNQILASKLAASTDDSSRNVRNK